VNKKELEECNEYLTDIVEKMAFVIEVLEAELEPGPGSDGGSSEPDDEMVDGDGPVDPLEEARIAAIHVYDLVGAVVDIAEGARTRYGLRKQDVPVPRESVDRVPAPPRPKRKRQLTLPGTGREAGAASQGEKDGKSTDAPKKLRFTTRKRS